MNHYGPIGAERTDRDRFARGQVEELLAARPDVVVDRDALARDWIDPAWITEEGGLRLRPDVWADKGGMDGFYIAVLRKI